MFYDPWKKLIFLLFGGEKIQQVGKRERKLLASTKKENSRPILMTNTQSVTFERTLGCIKKSKLFSRNAFGLKLC